MRQQRIRSAGNELHGCNANASVAYVVAFLQRSEGAELRVSKNGKDLRTHFVSTLPSVHALRAVNGRNETDVIQALLDSELPFHNLSGNVRKWGALATVITHFQMMQYQVEHRIPYQVTMEDDVFIGPTFLDMVMHACNKLDEDAGIDILQLSRFNEVR